VKLVCKHSLIDGILAFLKCARFRMLPGALSRWSRSSFSVELRGE
jgi:hypothetical protein